MTHENFLLEKYGPLMRMEDLAELLSRSKGGLRLSLSSDPVLAELFGSAKIKIGRRIYFRTLEVADMLDNVLGRNSAKINH
jgi:hypothetical protein